MHSKYQTRIELVGNQLKVIGSLSLLNCFRSKLATEGEDVKKWTKFVNPISNEEVLLNHFIEKLTSKQTEEHDEVCHCRLVSRITIVDSILQGCRTPEEISKSTLAGTGCGSCKKDLEKILNKMLNKDS